MRAHDADLQKAEVADYQRYPQAQQPSAHTINPGASHQKARQDDAPEMDQVSGPEVTVYEFADGAPLTGFADTRSNRFFLVQEYHDDLLEELSCHEKGITGVREGMLNERGKASFFNQFTQFSMSTMPSDQSARRK
jgi:hypothetical protein